MPTPRSFSHWNFKAIDPAAAVFAKEVKSQNIFEDMFKVDSENLLKTSRNSHQNKSAVESKKHSSSSSSRKRQENLNSDLHSSSSAKLQMSTSEFQEPVYSHPAWFLSLH